MSPFLRSSVLVVTALLTLVDAPRVVAADNKDPVVVELFTSQGCSTCPPADKLLTELGKKGASGPVITLAYHVDYWNQLGWKDPFSAAMWSQRQVSYEKALGQDHVVTPQFVVDGRSQYAGSERSEVLRLIDAERSQQPAAQVDLSVSGGPMPSAGDSGPGQSGGSMGGAPAGPLHVRVSAKVLRQAVNGKLDLMIAVTQSGNSTKVKAGENSSATLHEDYIVRQLQRALSMDSTADAHQSTEFDLPLDPSWPRGSLALVAFLQDPASQAILGAATARVPMF
jgi:hypothetical protein